MSDSDSDMPEAVSFTAAKKNIITTQKDLKKATLSVVPKKKRVRRRNELSDNEDEQNNDADVKQAQTNKNNKQQKSNNNNLPQSLNAKVDQNLLSLINEELPTKKLKQLEGKFKVVERSSQNNKNGKKQIETKKMIIESEVHKAKKDLGEGIKVVFSKQIKSSIPVNTSATNFLQNRLNLSNAKRQPISRIIGNK